MRSTKTIKLLPSNLLKPKTSKLSWLPVNKVLYLGRTERDGAVNQVKMVEGLQKQFKKKYEDLIKEAQ